MNATLHTLGQWRVDQWGDIWSDEFASPIARQVMVQDRPLLSAAPDLLEACEEALHVMRQTDLPSHMEAIEYCKAALAKAE